MAFELNELQMMIFRNDRKERENQPDYNGSVKVEGKEYWVACWTKDGKKGKYLSCALTPKEEQTPVETENKADFDDDIPF